MRYSLFVQAENRIERPRETRRVVWELSVESGTLPRLPSTASQRVESDGAATRVVTEVGSSPVVRTFDTAPFLRASTYLNFEDPQVRELSARALSAQALRETGSSAGARAEALRDFVFEYLEKADQDTNFATATEAAATRSGDCTEHAVLLTALLRAAGIPARTVTGLLYLNFDDVRPGVLGFHMWSQALVDQRWIDLDAMSPSSDASYIAFYTDAMNADQGDTMRSAALFATLGDLRVRVLEVVY